MADGVVYGKTIKNLAGLLTVLCSGIASAPTTINPQNIHENSPEFFGIPPARKLHR